MNHATEFFNAEKPSQNLPSPCPTTIDENSPASNSMSYNTSDFHLTPRDEIQCEQSEANETRLRPCNSARRTELYSIADADPNIICESTSIENLYECMDVFPLPISQKRDSSRLSWGECADEPYTFENYPIDSNADVRFGDTVPIQQECPVFENIQKKLSVHSENGERKRFAKLKLKTGSQDALLRCERVDVKAHKIQFEAWQSGQQSRPSDIMKPKRYFFDDDSVCSSRSSVNSFEDMYNSLNLSDFIHPSDDSRKTGTGGATLDDIVEYTKIDTTEQIEVADITEAELTETEVVVDIAEQTEAEQTEAEGDTTEQTETEVVVDIAEQTEAEGDTAEQTETEVVVDIAEQTESETAGDCDAPNDSNPSDARDPDSRYLRTRSGRLIKNARGIPSKHRPVSRIFLWAVCALVCAITASMMANESPSADLVAVITKETTIMDSALENIENIENMGEDTVVYVDSTTDNIVEDAVADVDSTDIVVYVEDAVADVDSANIIVAVDDIVNSAADNIVEDTVANVDSADDIVLDVDSATNNIVENTITDMDGADDIVLDVDGADDIVVDVDSTTDNMVEDTIAEMGGANDIVVDVEDTIADMNSTADKVSASMNSVGTESETLGDILIDIFSSLLAF